MRPIDLNTLLHYYVVREDMKNIANCEVQEGIQMFIDKGLMQPSSTYELCSFSLTKKGEFWMNSVLETPFPEERFVIPKQNED